MPETPNPSIEGTCGAKPERRAVFLDLNGTIVLPLKQESLDEMTLIPGADLAIMRLLAAGFLCPSSQSRRESQRGCSQSPSFVPGLLISLGTWGST